MYIFGGSEAISSSEGANFARQACHVRTEDEVVPPALFFCKRSKPKSGPGYQKNLQSNCHTLKYEKKRLFLKKGQQRDHRFFFLLIFGGFFRKMVLETP